MKRIFLICTLLVCTYYMIYADHREPIEGEIVWQISKSKQSPFIQYATGSLWSHCGIVVIKTINHMF